MKEPTLGMIELKSVARGIVVTDAIAKKAQVKILEAHAVQPGKFIILICGEVAEVEESLKEGVEVGSDFVINHLFLPYIHRDIIPALKGNLERDKKIPLGAVGILESFSLVHFATHVVHSMIHLARMVHRCQLLFAASLCVSPSLRASFSLPRTSQTKHTHK